MHRRTPLTCHCEERKRRGNLAGPGSRESDRRNRNCLPEIATSAFGLLAMTIRGPLPFYRQPVRIVSAAPGAACRSRQCTPNSYWLPLKWYTPIASVAALSERLVHLQIMQRKFIGMRLPSLSLRGPEGAVAISSNRLRFRRGLPVIQLCTARLPRRFAPRNDTSRSMTQGTVRCTEMAVLLPLRGRRGMPRPYDLHCIP